MMVNGNKYGRHVVFDYVVINGKSLLSYGKVRNSLLQKKKEIPNLLRKLLLI